MATCFKDAVTYGRDYVLYWTANHQSGNHPFAVTFRYVIGHRKVWAHYDPYAILSEYRGFKKIVISIFTKYQHRFQTLAADFFFHESWWVHFECLVGWALSRDHANFEETLG